MSEGHREAVAWPFAMHADATNRMQQITRDLTAIAHAICSFVHAQQNCENPIRAIFFMAQGRKRGPAKRPARRCGT
jgi:hypothetical protein